MTYSTLFGSNRLTTSPCCTPFAASMMAVRITAASNSLYVNWRLSASEKRKSLSGAASTRCFKSSGIIGLIKPQMNADLHRRDIFAGTCMNTYRNFIGGKWIESASTRTAQNINPANTDDVLGTIRQATREEARTAVEAAANAFRGWRATPAPARGKVVAKAARLMEENKEELAQLLTHEEGKTIAESRGELQRSINVAEFCAGESRRMTGETIPSELPSNFAYTIKQPLGVVACVTPWNFPVAIPVWKIARACRRQHRGFQARIDHACDSG